MGIVSDFSDKLTFIQTHWKLWNRFGEAWEEIWLFKKHPQKLNSQNPGHGVLAAWKLKKIQWKEAMVKVWFGFTLWAFPCPVLLFEFCGHCHFLFFYYVSKKVWWEGCSTSIVPWIGPRWNSITFSLNYESWYILISLDSCLRYYIYVHVALVWWEHKCVFNLPTFIKFCSLEYGFDRDSWKPHLVCLKVQVI